MIFCELAISKRSLNDKPFVWVVTQWLVCLSVEHVCKFLLGVLHGISNGIKDDPM